MAFLRVIVVTLFIIDLASSNLTVRSFGREATFGQLYDARTDKFFPETIVKEGLPDKFFDLKQTNTLSSSNTEPPPTFPGESPIFGLEELEKLKILTDYIQPSGSLVFMKHGQIDPSNSLIMGKNLSNSVTETLVGWITYDFGPYLNPEPLKTNKDATHILVGITYGDDTLILLEDESGNNISDSFALDLMRDNSTPDPRDSDIAVEFFTDIPPPPQGYPTTAQELRGKYSGIYDYIDNYNNGIGIKKMYRMIDIGTVRFILSLTGIQQPNWQKEVSFKSLNIHPLNIFKKISEVDHEIDLVEKQLKAIPPFEKLSILSSDIGKEWTDLTQKFKKELMEFINLSRSKAIIPADLIDSIRDTATKIKRFKQTTEFDKLIQNYETKITLYNLYQKDGNGQVQFLGSNPEDLPTNFVALILPINSRIEHEENFYPANVYFLDELSGPRFVIDCELLKDNNYCNVTEPEIVEVDNGKILRKIPYSS